MIYDQPFGSQPGLFPSYEDDFYEEDGPYLADAIEIQTPFSSQVALPAGGYFAPQPRSEQDLVQQRMTIILAAVVFMAVLFALFRMNTALHTAAAAVSVAPAPPAETAAQSETESDSGPATTLPVAGGGISPIFSPEVQYWADKIVAWSSAFGIDPNMAATIMQIESCGDPGAASGAGAQGLFQVMPFHFTAGEDMLNPETNARRGLNYFVERLEQTGGDVGKAFAGYNGGHVAAGGSWNSWANETQRYYVWSTGIYEEASQGLTESSTLNEWMAAGGASLCNQAANRLGLQ